MLFKSQGRLQEYKQILWEFNELSQIQLSSHCAHRGLLKKLHVFLLVKEKKKSGTNILASQIFCLNTCTVKQSRCSGIMSYTLDLQMSWVLSQSPVPLLSPLILIKYGNLFV